MAHAWPEVYLDGIGWIPFEPTPGYSEMRYCPWETRGGEDSGFSDGGREGENAGIERQESIRRQSERDLEGTDSGEKGEDGEQENNTRILTGPGIVRFLEIFGGAVFSVLCGVLIILVLTRLMGIYRYRRMKEGEKLRTEVYRNIQILSLLGVEREEETLEEYRLRAERILTEKDCLQFLESYEAILYGRREADRHILEETIRQQRALTAILKKRKRGTYFFYLLFRTRSR